MPSAIHNAFMRTGKRVAKACDYCRLKKSKCDGFNPCERCKSDNKICGYTERKRSHGQTYPEGYVEMLERQQAQLTAAIRKFYRILNAGECWPGARLAEQNDGYPLIHDVLERLDVLRQNHRFLQPARSRDGSIDADRMLQETEAQTCPYLQPPAGSDSSSAGISPPSSSHYSHSASPAMQLGSVFTDFPTSLTAMNQHDEDAQRFLSTSDFDVMPQTQFSDTKDGAPHAIEGVQSLFTADHMALDHAMYSSCVDFGY